MKTNSLKGSNCKSNGKHIFALKLKKDKLVFLFFFSLNLVVYSITIMAQMVSINCFISLYFTHLLQLTALNLRSYYVMLITL